MAEPDHSPDSNGSSGSGVSFLIVVPLLYVLGIGPAAALGSRTNNGRGAAVLAKVYAPVNWLHDHTLWKEPLEAYVELWGVR